MADSLIGIRQPRRARGAATIERIVVATRALLEDHIFRDVSVTEIMERAGMSVGSFYTRFATKEALLPYLYAHYDEELEQFIDEALEPGAWVGLSLPARLQRLVSFGVDMYRANRGLWRSILIHASSNPSIVTEEHQQRRKRMVHRLTALLLERRDELTHPDPEEGVEFCLVLLFAICKDQILLAEASHGPARVSDEVLKRRLVETMLAYLGARPIA